jgi:hypothetical protein
LMHEDVIWLQHKASDCFLSFGGYSGGRGKCTQCPSDPADRVGLSGGCWNERLKIVRAEGAGPVKNGDYVFIHTYINYYMFCSDAKYCAGDGDCPSQGAHFLTMTTPCRNNLFRVYNSKNDGDIISGADVWIKHTRNDWYGTSDGGQSFISNFGCPGGADWAPVGCTDEAFVIYGNTVQTATRRLAVDDSVPSSLAILPVLDIAFNDSVSPKSSAVEASAGEREDHGQEHMGSRLLSHYPNGGDTQTIGSRYYELRSIYYMYRDGDSCTGSPVNLPSCGLDNADFRANGRLIGCMQATQECWRDTRNDQVLCTAPLSLYRKESYNLPAQRTQHLGNAKKHNTCFGPIGIDDCKCDQGTYPNMCWSKDINDCSLIIDGTPSCWSNEVGQTGHVLTQAMMDLLQREIDNGRNYAHKPSFYTQLYTAYSKAYNDFCAGPWGTPCHGESMQATGLYMITPQDGQCM